jgi:hypothetical protein
VVSRHLLVLDADKKQHRNLEQMMIAMRMGKTMMMMMMASKTRLSCQKAHHRRPKAMTATLGTTRTTQMISLYRQVPLLSGLNHHTQHQSDHHPSTLLYLAPWACLPVRQCTLSP